MGLLTVDWLVIAAYFAFVLAIGFAVRKRAGRSLADYFVSGRSLPWWVAGTSMVATTFAADTPLAVTGLVAQHGLAGNWFWWSFAMGGMFTVFIFARLWRRTGVLTDVEFIELRYGGRPAAFLRGFRALYVALLINSIIIGWVTGAMLRVLNVLVLTDQTGETSSDWPVILGLLGIVGIYSTIGGLWSVTITDFLQFFIAMAGCVVLAAIAVNEVGGTAALQAAVIEKFPAGEQAFRFLPDFSGASAWMTVDVFLLMLFVQWWATWYPGAEPGGGGYIVQRMASCRDERHAMLATLWYQLAHYCVRPWPWLMIAFVALAVYDLGALDDPGQGFAMVIRDYAPPGLRGLMLVAFFSAFMSTISTQMNWGASYLVNDFYGRFIAPHASNRHLTIASRAASVVVLAIGAFAAYHMRGVSVDQAWKFLAALGAGTGAVFMLRWFWWRINAYSEIAAMVASLLAFSGIQALAQRENTSTGVINWVATPEYQMAIVALLTIPTWLVVTLLTPAESPEKLKTFFELARPGGPGWKPISRQLPGVRADRTLGVGIVASLVAGLMVYLTIPGIGALIFGRWLDAGWLLAGAAGCGLVIARLLPKLTAAAYG